MAKKLNSESEETLMQSAEKYAKKAGIKLNPNKEQLKSVIAGLFMRKQKFGEAYCPCRVVTNKKSKDKEIICPCVFHRGEIELQGNCRCNLFFGEKG